MRVSSEAATHMRERICISGEATVDKLWISVERVDSKGLSTFNGTVGVWHRDCYI